jgi:hypothetical protein
MEHPDRGLFPTASTVAFLDDSSPPEPPCSCNHVDCHRHEKTGAIHDDAFPVNQWNFGEWVRIRDFSRERLRAKAQKLGGT